MCWSQKQSKDVYEAASYKIETIPDRLAAVSIETIGRHFKVQKGGKEQCSWSM